MKCNLQNNHRVIRKILFCFFIIPLVVSSVPVFAASTTLTFSVSQTEDDAEEQGPFPGPMENLDSSDLEIVYESGATEQVVGVRFQGINIKQGATVSNAYVQFQADNTNTGTTNVLVFGEDEDDTVEFSTSNGDISTRTRTTAEVQWTGIPAWNTVGEAGTNQRTPDISSIINEIIQRSGWAAFNSIVIMIESDTGCSAPDCEREAESFDGTAAPQLVITLDDSDVAQSYTVSQTSDDAEEQGAGVPGSPGTMENLDSTDLEINYEGGNRQVVGIRFQNIEIFQGETGITNAYIQFTVDETDTGTTNVVIYGEDEDDTSTFTSANGNITSRTKTTASVLWSGIAAWNTVGEQGTDQRTPDITSIISEIVQRPGWSFGNSITIIIEPGTGCTSSACQRTAESFDGSAPPRLVIELDANAVPNIIVSTTNNSTLGGQAMDQDEAVEYDASTDTGTLFLDDATFGNNANTDAIHVLANGNLAISTTADESIGGNAFGDDDIVEISPTGTAGIYNFVQILFDGGTHFANTNEEVDAVYVRENGNIVLSTAANARLPRCGGGNLNFNDTTLVEWDVTNLCATSIINFAPRISGCFDSGGGGNTDEDIFGVHYIGDNENLVLITLRHDCTIDGQAFEDGDVILYNRNTSTASTYFDESNFSSGNEDINALTLALPTTPATIDHYDIDFSSATGITCLPVDVTITAKDDTNTTVNHSSNTTIDFNVSTNLGQWATTQSSGTGTLSDPTPGTPDNGDARYEFPSGESSVTIPLSYTEFAVAGNSETFEIDITTTPDEDGGIANADDDPSVTFEFTAIIFNNVTDINNTITTQISGKPSNTEFNAKTYNLQVLNADEDDPSVCQSIFGNGDVVSIELGAECKNPTSCAGRELNIDNINPALPAAGVNIDTSNDDAGAQTVASYEAVDLEFGTDSTAEIVLTYPDAGSLELHARYELLLDDGVTGSGEYATGITNSFVVRPFGFAFESIEDSGAVANPAAVDATGAVFVKAGEDFVATVKAYNWGTGDDDGTDCNLVIEPGCAADDGIPDTNANLSDNNGGSGGEVTPNFQGTGAIDVTLSAIAPFAPSAGTLGDLEDSGTMAAPVITAASFSSGEDTISTIYYDEVGTMTLRADGSNYLSSGQNITGKSSNISANPNNGSVGRFYPDRFNVTMNNTPAFADSCSGFTYQDQTFHYGTAPTLRVEAFNNYGDTTVNYGGTFWKLTSSMLNRDYSDGSAVAPNASLFPNTTVTGGVTLAGDSDFDGVGTLSLTAGSSGDSLIYQKGDPESVFDADVDVTFLAAAFQDTDHTGSDPICFDAANDGTCDDFTYLMMQGTELRWGRMVLDNAFGSELLAIEVPISVEYFGTDDFEINTDDTCTTYDSADMSFSNADPVGILGNLTLTGSGTMISGQDDPANSVLATSTANEVGSADVTIDLIAQDWLQYDWDNDTNHDNDPTSRITWGVFSGPDEFIYIREPW